MFFRDFQRKSAISKKINKIGPVSGLIIVKKCKKHKKPLDFYLHP